MPGATIFALSSGAPPAAIGVIRVSGPAAGHALATLCGRLPEPRRATVGALRDPATGERLDTALLLWFPGPTTATGEDLAELHVHGGRAVVRAVLARLTRIEGLRSAEPGEFTRRAFANGVLDLAEAEGLADLLAAETDSQRRNAQHLIGGMLGREVAGWQRRLLAIAAQLEAVIEFDEDEDLAVDHAPALRDAAALLIDMDAALARPPAERLKDGVRVVLAGPPNAGKSTLLNRIVEREAAITSPAAGTTRDLIEIAVAIEGMPFVFVDTAGVHDDTDDMVERIGMARARDAACTADILVWMGDPADAPQHPAVIRLHPRCDLPGRTAAHGADLAVSAVTGEGISELTAHIVRRSAELFPKPSELALNRRQREILGESVAHLRFALPHRDVVLAAEGVQLARRVLDRLTGAAGTEEMLDALFARFCVGK